MPRAGSTAGTADLGGRRGQLVEAAFDLIAAKGLEGLRLRDVAAVVGLDQSTLHYYFPTKEDLVRQVVEHATRELWPTIGSVGSAGDQLRTHLRLMATMMKQRPAVFVVLAELNLRAMRDSAVRELIDEHDSGWRAALLTRITEMTTIEGLDPSACTELVIATIKGATFNPGAAEALLEELERLLIGTAAHQ